MAVLCKSKPLRLFIIQWWWGGGGGGGGGGCGLRAANAIMSFLLSN